MADGPFKSNRPGLKEYLPLGALVAVFAVSASLLVYKDAPENLQRTLLIISLMAVVFSWGIFSVARNSRYRAKITERLKLSSHLLLRNRELTSLNGIASAFTGEDELDGFLIKALRGLVEDTGARGAAVLLAQPPEGGLVLRAQVGMPERFVSEGLKSGTCCFGGVMGDGRPKSFKKWDPAVAHEAGCAGLEEEDLAVVPLVAKKKPLGLLCLWGFEAEEHEEGPGQFYMAIGNQFASVLQNALQMEDIRRHSARAGALFNTAQALTKSLDLDALLQIIMQEAAALLKVRRCLLLLYNEEANRAECRVALGFENSPAGHFSFSPSGIFWEAMGDGRLKVVDLRERREDVPEEFLEGLGLERFFLVPLVSRGKVLGFIVLEMLANEREMLEDLKLTAGFANQAAVAIETSSFYIRTIEQYNLDLQQLSNRIIETQEEERKRIARDLHDELGQSLTAIKINLDMVKGALPPEFGQLKGRVGDAINLVVSTLDSVRRLSFEIRPSMLDDLGLSTALGKLVSDFKKRTGIEAELIEEGLPERLSPQAEVGLYRVVQEALTNIAKHADASNVTVRLVKGLGTRNINLSISDDGRGFDVTSSGQAAGSKGFGLMGIRERVLLLGGNFRIESVRGLGTKLAVDIPIVEGEALKWKEM